MTADPGLLYPSDTVGMMIDQRWGIVLLDKSDKFLLLSTDHLHK